MALTLPGSPYVESSDLVANYPAVSESLAERVDLVGVLPFADSAARTTALPSPTDGQYSYLQDTNTTQFWNGSAWQTAGLTPGLTLVTPTSIANTGGTSSLSGGEVTFTGVGTISLNNIFTSTYNTYRISVTAIGSAGLDMYARVRASGTDLSGAVYGINTLRIFSTSTTAAAQANATAFNMTPIRTAGYGTNIFDIVNPFVATYTNMTGEGADPQNELVLFKGTVLNTTAYDGITIYPNAGNMTGTVRCYAYQKS